MMRPCRLRAGALARLRWCTKPFYTINGVTEAELRGDVMPTHDPLTAEHIAILDEFKSGPVRITTQERLSGPRGQAIGFLITSGFITEEVEHVAVNPNDSIRLLRRTDKVGV
jgi:hypothetical protein